MMGLAPGYPYFISLVEPPSDDLLKTAEKKSYPLPPRNWYQPGRHACHRVL
jgi:hypothetical protein